MPDHFAIRIANLDDASRVGDLLVASYPALMSRSYDKSALAAALPIMTRANPALLKANTYYVAETANGQIVGCGGWTREQPGTGHVEAEIGHIRHFATHPEWLNQGIGRSIYSQCESSARSVGIRCFECYSSLNAEGFYQALGFRPILKLEIPMGRDNKLASVLMKRRI